MRKLVDLFSVLSISVILAGITSVGAGAVLLTDPDDARSWQGANVGTFAGLYYGSDTPANRQAVIDAGLLDDSYFDGVGYVSGSLVANNWSNGISGGDHVGGGCLGVSSDLT